MMGLKIANIGLLLVISVLLTIETSMCGSIENEKLAALSDRFDKLLTKVESLEAENEALKIRVDYLERKDVKNEAKLREQEEEINQLKANMDSKLEFGQSNGPSSDGLVTDLRSFNEKMNSIYRIEDPSDDSSTRAVVPSSCDELSLIGHTLNGPRSKLGHQKGRNRLLRFRKRIFNFPRFNRTSRCEDQIRPLLRPAEFQF